MNYTFQNNFQNRYDRDYGQYEESYQDYYDNQKYDDSTFGKNIEPIDWSIEKLLPFQKDFYQEHPATTSRSIKEIKDFREKHEISVRTHSNIETPRPIFNFNEAGFQESILQTIYKLGYEYPTPIQSQSWSISLKGYDLIGIAETGSGKTLSFTLPAIIHLQAQENLKYGDGPIVLVLAPTRELAMQIHEQVKKFCESQKIRTTCIYGGVDKYYQRKDLERGCHIIIATPGRLIDFLDERATNLRRITYLVIDEADRMLDMGFEPQIRIIVSQIRPDRQTLMWSATWPKSVQQLARDLCKENPIIIRVGSEDLQANRKIEQKFEFVEEDEKKSKLDQILQSIGKNGKMIIFCQTKKTCDLLARELNKDGYRCIVIHGNKSQNERDRVMGLFRSGKCNILVATDIAARGLDVRDIKYVINFDFPNQVEDYIHRIGRTGRAGADGTSYTFLTSENARFADELMDMLGESEQEIPQELKEISLEFKNTQCAREKQNYSLMGNKTTRSNTNKPFYNSYNNNTQSNFQNNNINNNIFKQQNTQQNAWRGPTNLQQQTKTNYANQTNQPDIAWRNLTSKQEIQLTTNAQGAPKFGFFNSKKSNQSQDLNQNQQQNNFNYNQNNQFMAQQQYYMYQGMGAYQFQNNNPIIQDYQTLSKLATQKQKENN